MQKKAPCWEPERNDKAKSYDDYLGRRMNEILLKKHNCTVAFDPLSRKENICDYAKASEVLQDIETSPIAINNLWDYPGVK